MICDARVRNHLGQTLTLRPSQIKLLFELHEQGWSYQRIHREHFADLISYAGVKRIGHMGREGFDEDWNRILVPDPINKYKGWRNDDTVRLEPVRGRQLPDIEAEAT